MYLSIGPNPTHDIDMRAYSDTCVCISCYRHAGDIGWVHITVGGCIKIKHLNRLISNWLIGVADAVDEWFYESEFNMQGWSGTSNFKLLTKKLLTCIQYGHTVRGFIEFVPTTGEVDKDALAENGNDHKKRWFNLPFTKKKPHWLFKIEKLKNIEIKHSYLPGSSSCILGFRNIHVVQRVPLAIAEELVSPYTAVTAAFRSILFLHLATENVYDIYKECKGIIDNIKRWFSLSNSISTSLSNNISCLALSPFTYHGRQRYLAETFSWWGVGRFSILGKNPLCTNVKRKRDSDRVTK